MRYKDQLGTPHRIEYAYNGDDLLAVVKTYEDGMLVEETRILRDGMLALQDSDDENAIQSEYSWGLNLGGGPSTLLRAGIGGLLNLKQGGVEYSYLYDGKGNVEAVLDSAQAVVAAYRDDPFGRFLATSGSFEQPFQFSTKRYNAQIGMLHYPRTSLPGPVLRTRMSAVQPVRQMLTAA